LTSCRPPPAAAAAGRERTKSQGFRSSSIIRVMSLAVASLSRQCSLEPKSLEGRGRRGKKALLQCPQLSQAGNSRLTERLVQPTVQIWIRRLYASTLQQETK